MVRKITGMVVALTLFFGLTLNAGAAPVSSTPVNNIYTQSYGPMADDDSYAIDVAEDVAVGAVAGVVARAAYDFGTWAYRSVTNYFRVQSTGIPRIEEQSLDNRAEIVFDY